MLDTTKVIFKAIKASADVLMAKDAQLAYKSDYTYWAKYYNTKRIQAEHIWVKGKPIVEDVYHKLIGIIGVVYAYCFGFSLQANEYFNQLALSAQQEPKIKSQQDDAQSVLIEQITDATNKLKDELRDEHLQEQTKSADILTKAPKSSKIDS